MADLRTYQPSFTAGELSPALWARVDLTKYASGLKTAVNVFIHPHGGASNRPGTEFVREVKDSTKPTRLEPFQFNSEQTYMLEVGDKYMRVFKDGAVITSGGVPYELVTPYPSTALEHLVLNQENDIAYITHADFAPRKLSRLAEDDWSISGLSFTPSIAAPASLTGSAYFNRRNGSGGSASFRVTAVGPTGLESAPSASVSRWILWETGRDDGRMYKFTWNAVPGATLYRLYRTGSDAGLLVEAGQPEAVIDQYTINGVDPQAPSAGTPGAPDAPTGVTMEVLWGEPMKYVVAAISEESSEESLPSSPVTVNNDLAYATNRNVLNWAAVPGASEYTIYKDSNGVYGYIGRSETTTFTDRNIVADIADGPQSARNPFDGPGHYPRVSSFIEQRLAFASTAQEPQGVWMSQSANYENFSVASPAKASDAVTFRIKSQQANEIRALVAVKGMMALTSGAEWLISGGTQSDAIAPNAIKVDNQGYRGAARVQPIVVGNTVLFAQARGGVVRDFSFDFANDGFDGKDLTILARHLFEGREIKSWAYAQAPDSIVWTVLDDGSLVSLTYLKEHDVWAWTRHESGPGNDAKFEDVAVISEGPEDVPYFIVRRTIGGVQKRYIERLHTRRFAAAEDAFFVDCGLTYAGAPVSTISGLDHLEGQDVVALADGNVVRGLVVSDGAVTLPNAASKVHVGLPMAASMQPLDLDLGMVQTLGSVQGRTKSVANVTLRVEKTRGIFVGPRDGERGDEHLVEFKQRQLEAWNEAIRLHTGDISMTPAWDWNTSGAMWIKQFDPLPMTILAIMPDVVIGR
jgi:hypothetical protein